jgi:GDP-L-fucose synthase
MQQSKDSKIVVTGASSMIGRSVIKQLEVIPDIDIVPVYHQDYDLLNIEHCKYVLKDADYCIHCAGYNGNISFNQLYPADIFYRTTMMAMNVLRSAHELGIKKVVSPLASCAYPNQDILKEYDFWNGPPNETVEAHGLSKRNILAYSRQLYKQYKFKSVCLVFNTCYGPYDSFDIKKTKVVGGLINKFINAKINNDKSVVCWGTGSPRRELIYCDDAAASIINVLKHYDNPNVPINIGTGLDISIKELAETVRDIVGYKGEIEWDLTKPDGQYQKLLDITKYKNTLPQIKFTPIKDGLTKTIEWYKEMYNVSS